MIAITFLALQAQSQVDDLLNMLPSDKKDLALTTLNLLPADQKQGITDYLAVTGIVSYSSENKGFKKFNQSLLKSNPCINELAATFYSDISISDLDLLLKDAFANNSLGKPSLNKTVHDLKLKPGWLWEKALHFAQGDKLLAMQLIGVCGHDDASQLDGDFRLASAEKMRGYKLKYSDEELNQKINELWKTYSSENKKITEEMGGSTVLLQHLKKTVDFQNGVSCPSATSAMYYPQALGEKYDLSNALKTRITSVQAPVKGKESLPAKAYHIMGAAYSSCFLVRRNVPDFVSKKIVTGAINAYRSARVCANFANFDPRADNKSVDVILKDIESVKNNFELCLVKSAGKSTIAGEEKAYSYWMPQTGKTPNYCYAGFFLNPSLILDKDVTDEIIARKVTRKLAERDARIMFTKSKYYLSANKCVGEQLGSDVRDFLQENSFTKNKSACGEGIDQKRCEEARKVIETYAVDFEWSETQHTQGLEFAKENCPRMDSTKNLNDLACKALGKTNLPSGVQPHNQSPAIKGIN